MLPACLNCLLVLTPSPLSLLLRAQMALAYQQKLRDDAAVDVLELPSPESSGELQDAPRSARERKTSSAVTRQGRAASLLSSMDTED